MSRIDLMDAPVMFLLKHEARRAMPSGFTVSSFAYGSFGYGERLLFWLLVLVHVVPIWLFRFFPTQDGPVHLSTSIMLKEYGGTGVRYHEFFDLHLMPVPNWTMQLCLVFLMRMVPPLIAEKLFVSGFVFLFAFALRYFCGTFNPCARACAMLGLLFVYNRCLWLGFYNYNVSLALCMMTLAYYLRSGEYIRARRAAVLCILLLATYFTHLFGFVVAVAGLSWFVLTLPRQFFQHLVWLVLSVLPAGLLTLNYFHQTGFGAFSREVELWNDFAFTSDLAALGVHYFGHHIQCLLPMWCIAGVIYVAWTTASLFVDRAVDNTQSKIATFSRAQLALGTLVVALILLYFLTPDKLGKHGSFLKARLALFPPVLVLGCMVESSGRGTRLVLRTLVAVVLLTNLGFVIRRVAADNRELAEYTAGITYAGRGQALFILQDLLPLRYEQDGYTANPLMHASHYYCLDTKNVNLDNYQAQTDHFPLRFRDGIVSGRGFFLDNMSARYVDRVLAWESDPRLVTLRSFQSVFRRGRLEIFVRSPE